MSPRSWYYLTPAFRQSIYLDTLRLVLRKCIADLDARRIARGKLSRRAA